MAQATDKQRSEDPQGRGDSPLGALLAADTKLPHSRAEHVWRNLREAIIFGPLEPGQRISEEELAAIYGVSRTPVREALRLLRSEGLVVHEQGRGARVAPLVTRGDARVLYHVRVDVEGTLAGRACERLSGDDLDHLSKVHERFCELAGPATGDEAIERTLVNLDADFHMTIYRAADSPLLISIVNSYWGQLLRNLHRSNYSAEQPVRFIPAHDSFLDQHRLLLEAFEERNSSVARATMRKHLRDAYGAASLRPAGDGETERTRASTA